MSLHAYAVEITWECDKIIDSIQHLLFSTFGFDQRLHHMVTFVF